MARAPQQVREQCLKRLRIVTDPAEGAAEGGVDEVRPIQLGRLATQRQVVPDEVREDPVTASEQVLDLAPVVPVEPGLRLLG